MLKIAFFLNLENYMLPCINKKLFGMDCMGCGFQRSLLLLIKGDFVAAFKMYPAIYTLLFFIVYIFLNIKFRFNNSQMIIRSLFIINTVLILGNFILKLI